MDNNQQIINKQIELEKKITLLENKITKHKNAILYNFSGIIILSGIYLLHIYIHK
jgi:hypothetical protein